MPSLPVPEMHNINTELTRAVYTQHYSCWNQRAQKGKTHMCNYWLVNIQSLCICLNCFPVIENSSFSVSRKRPISVHFLHVSTLCSWVRSCVSGGIAPHFSELTEVKTSSGRHLMVFITQPTGLFYSVPLPQYDSSTGTCLTIVFLSCFSFYKFLSVLIDAILFIFLLLWDFSCVYCNPPCTLFQ